MLLEWLLILGGAGALLWSFMPQSGKNKPDSNAGLIYGAGAFLVAGEIVGRYIFYAAIVGPGVGLV